jgi:prophage antirepressor-like protein
MEQDGRPESAPAIQFSFEGRALRTVAKDGQTWFVAADVCAVLEHSDASKAVSRLDDDEKGATNVRTLGGVQEMNVVNESGLYNLIFTSRKRRPRSSGGG